MKQFLIKILIFSFAALCIYVPTVLYVLPSALEHIYGPSTKRQITQSFNDIQKKEYDLIVLGNSGPYRGINPDSLKIPAYNFAHDNDSYNQMYYKLLWMERNKIKFNAVLVSVDYFQFNIFSGTRNYVYNSYFENEYQEDYPSFTANLDVFLNRTQILDISRLQFLLKFFEPKKTERFMKANGQYIKPSKAKVTDDHIYSMERLPVQENYFRLIIDYCTKNDIEVVICMLPKRKNILRHFEKDKVDEFNNYINTFTNEKIHYLNYAAQEGWTVDDYTDRIHFNENAANKFSKILNEDMLRLLKKNSLTTD